MRMLRQKTHIDYKKVAYSLFDKAIISSNSPETIEDYKNTRNPAVLNIPAEAIKFVLSPISASLYELIQKDLELDPRVYAIQQIQIKVGIELCKAAGVDPFSNPKTWPDDLVYEVLLAKGRVIDSLSEAERNLWNDYKNIEHRAQELWFRAGVKQIICAGESYTTDEFAALMDVAFYPKMREEMAELIRGMSELGPDLGK